MGFSANYKARAWMVTVQEKNCINLEIKEYEDPEVLAKTLTQIWEQSSKKNDRVCAVAVCRSANGLYHAHIAAYGNSTTLNCVAKVFGNAHVEPQLGGKNALKDYILKEGSYEEKGEEVLFSLGIENIQDVRGNRTDLDIIKDMIVDGAIPQQIFDTNIRYRKYEKMILSEYIAKRIKDAPIVKSMHCEWHCGESGSGKSYTYIKLCEKYGRENIYFLNDMLNGGLDLYMEQGAPRILFIDEVKPSDISYRQMLMLTDAYTDAQTHSRFHNTINLWDKVYVTSIYGIREFYNELVPTEKRDVESFEQLQRRFNKVVYHYKKNNEYKTYEQMREEGYSYLSILKDRVAKIESKNAFIKKLLSIPIDAHEIFDAQDWHLNAMLKQDEIFEDIEKMVLEVKENETESVCFNE